MTTLTQSKSMTVTNTLKTHTAKLLGTLDAIPLSVIGLIARIGLAGVFWRSGQTKVEGWQVTDSAIYLFEEEYALPFLPPELAANMAALAEHALPVLLILGLATRFGAAGLLAMTAVIQIFVYPASWPDHFTWAAGLVFLIARGGGIFSADYLIRKRFM